MAATGIGNPAGAVQLANMEPMIFTGKAMAGISGGVLVHCSGAADAISSGLNSYTWTDVVVNKDASGLAFNGIAMQSTGSGYACPFAMNGLFILTANGTVTAGYPVVCDGNNAVANIGGSPAVITQVGHAIGRALTGATSGGYCVVKLG